MPLLLGHRGARAFTSLPENTLASFDLALQHGCDGFEFDVRLTGCGGAVVCHDPQIGGITVGEATCEQLPDVPRLDQVVQRYAQRAFLDIELKVRGLESEVLLTLQRHPPEKGFLVSSFLPEVIQELRLRNANVPLGIICDHGNDLPACFDLPVEFIVAHHSLVKGEVIRKTHESGRQLLVWTVNDRKAMQRLADWGVDGIISDQTERLVQTLRRRS